MRSALRRIGPAPRAARFPGGATHRRHCPERCTTERRHGPENHHALGTGPRTGSHWPKWRGCGHDKSGLQINRVELPQPLGPTTATHSTRHTFRSRVSSATRNHVAPVRVLLAHLPHFQCRSVLMVIHHRRMVRVRRRQEQTLQSQPNRSNQSDTDESRHVVHRPA
jgi:hypothetical protein